MLVVDDHSIDQSPFIIKSLEVTSATSYGQTVTTLRNELLAKTATDWFILLDGDEVWSNSTIERFLDHIKNVPSNVTGVFLRTRNCVGDIWHYLPEDSGKYHLAGVAGHLNIRAYRKRKGYQWRGDYPLEYYGPEGQPINADASQLSFFHGYYWHLTHLSRTKSHGTAGFRRQVIETGILSRKEELPEVFFLPRPNFVPDPLTHRSSAFELKAKILTPFKKIKRLL